MCKAEYEKIRVRIPTDLSCTRKSKWKYAKIDRCIAPLVEAFQRAGIDMRGSCCGHGKGEGYIQLEDGRILIIRDNADEYLARL